ncbi:Flp family type IVb pilin [uncultured Aggregatibacter sp.]|uniref:Flp family type IVb pilin n=1 Tax=uncultured Aggregatibacter sp. TaxID=470564 RepID=UPI001A5E4208|nr:Flp family type IVb pilin [uncultured Aggregatibacter sp.]VTX80218.1 Flp/Fap pilin component [uncultured Aggregatibacter sp.]
MNLFFIKLKSIFNEFKSSEKGVTATEYGLIAVAVAAMIVATFYTYPSLVSTIRNDLIAVATIVMGQTF